MIQKKVYQQKQGVCYQNEEWVERPDCLTSLYNKIVRTVKRTAPYTELVDLRTHMDAGYYLEEYEYKHKEYISNYCLKLYYEEGYKLY